MGPRVTRTSGSRRVNHEGAHVGLNCTLNSLARTPTKSPTVLRPDEGVLWEVPTKVSQVVETPCWGCADSENVGHFGSPKVPLNIRITEIVLELFLLGTEKQRNLKRVQDMRAEMLGPSSGRSLTSSTLCKWPFSVVSDREWYFETMSRVFAIGTSRICKNRLQETLGSIFRSPILGTRKS